MICINFPSFRSRFATRAVFPTPDTFAFTAPGTIESGGANFDGQTPPFVAGMTLVMDGSASGNDTFTAAVVNGDTITTVEQTVVTEGSASITLCEGFTVDDSGWERWPVEYMRVGDTGTAFAGGITGYGADPYEGDTIILTCNGAVADSTYGVDEYDWYLSQRTDDAARQYLEIVQAGDDMGPVSYSGACRITPTALAETKFGFSTSGGVPIDPDITRMLFRSCDLYVRRISDQAIQRASLLEKVLGG